MDNINVTPQRLFHKPDLKVRLLHGKSDGGNTPFKNAEAFAEALQEAGYDVVFLPLEGYHESFQLEAIEEIKALED